jgi:hypothetical protein
MVGRISIGAATAMLFVALSTTAFAQNPYKHRFAAREARMLSRSAETVPQYGQGGRHRAKMRQGHAARGYDTMAQFQEVQF